MHSNNYDDEDEIVDWFLLQKKASYSMEDTLTDYSDLENFPTKNLAGYATPYQYQFIREED